MLAVTEEYRPYDLAKRDLILELPAEPIAAAFCDDVPMSPDCALDELNYWIDRIRQPFQVDIPWISRVVDFARNRF